MSKDPKYQPIYVTDGDNVIKRLRPADICYISSDKNYCRLYVLSKGKFYMVRKTMKQMETWSTGKGFIRIHDQHIVCKDYVDKINLFEKQVTMDTGDQLSLGRKYEEEFLKTLEIWK